MPTPRRDPVEEAQIRKRNRVIGVALLVVTALAVAGGLAIDKSRQSEASNVASTVSYSPPPSVAPKVITAHHQISDVMPRLADKTRPFNVVVFGDSTGVARRGWVVQLGEAMGASSGRTVTLNPWSVEQEPDGYVPSWGIAKGTTPPVTIWNGSASSTDSTYSLDKMDQIVPVQPDSIDLVLVNHGHNEGQGDLVSRSGALMRESITRFPNAAVVAILQNPERPGSAHATVQDANLASWRSYLARTGDPVIDVYTPYMQMPGWETAFDTPTGNLHPNQAGYDLWTGVVRQALGI